MKYSSVSQPANFTLLRQNTDINTLKHTNMYSYEFSR